MPNRNRIEYHCQRLPEKMLVRKCQRARISFHFALLPSLLPATSLSCVPLCLLKPSLGFVFPDWMFPQQGLTTLGQMTPVCVCVHAWMKPCKPYAVGHEEARCAPEYPGSSFFLRPLRLSTWRGSYRNFPSDSRFSFSCCSCVGSLTGPGPRILSGWPSDSGSSNSSGSINDTCSHSHDSPEACNGVPRQK